MGFIYLFIYFLWGLFNKDENTGKAFFLQLCRLLCCISGKLFYTLAKKKSRGRTKKECSPEENPKGKNWQNVLK